MSKRFTILLLSFYFCALSYAQNQVNLFIHHKYGDNDFALENVVQNNLGNDFYLTRLEYYISEITIKYDGGLKTTLNDLWILVDASEPTEVNLGMQEMNTIERITFSIGVDADYNHLDPSAYPTGHPLAPTFPSMHWGWASGYRFLALEGRSSPALNQNLEIHALGDINYFSNEGLPLNAPAVDGAIDIHLDADYTKILENIEVNSGLVIHDDFGQATTALENFRDFVFSPSLTSTSTKDISTLKKFNIYPNPSVNGKTIVELSTSAFTNHQLIISDLTGKVIQSFKLASGEQTLQLDLKHAGMYLLQVSKENQLLSTKKLVVH